MLASPRKDKTSAWDYTKSGTKKDSTPETSDASKYSTPFCYNNKELQDRDLGFRGFKLQLLNDDSMESQPFHGTVDVQGYQPPRDSYIDDTNQTRPSEPLIAGSSRGDHATEHQPQKQPKGGSLKFEELTNTKWPQEPTRRTEFSNGMPLIGEENGESSSDGAKRHGLLPPINVGSSTSAKPSEPETARPSTTQPVELETMPPVETAETEAAETAPSTTISFAPVPYVAEGGQPPLPGLQPDSWIKRQLWKLEEFCCCHCCRVCGRVCRHCFRACFHCVRACLRHTFPPDIDSFD